MGCLHASRAWNLFDSDNFPIFVSLRKAVFKQMKSKSLHDEDF